MKGRFWDRIRSSYIDVVLQLNPFDWRFSYVKHNSQWVREFSFTAGPIRVVMWLVK